MRTMHDWPNAPLSMGRTWYVAQCHRAASDENPGTRARPFRTISKAASLADMGDTVIIGRGTYREEVPLPRHGHPYVPTSIITYQAAGNGPVCLKGSAVLKGPWRQAEEGVHATPLPESLWQAGAYNPFALGLDLESNQPVRPCEGTTWPATRGEMFVNDCPLQQVENMAALRATAGAFAVSADGRELRVHFPKRVQTAKALVEITARRKCWKPLFDRPVFIQTKGMVVKHAAEPGAFERARNCTIRRNPAAGIVVRKTFALPGNTDRTCSLMIGAPCYLDIREDRLVTLFVDDLVEGPPDCLKKKVALSDDGGQAWRAAPDGHPLAGRTGQYFLDESNNRLIRSWLQQPSERADLDGAYGRPQHEIRMEYSADGGKTWTPHEVVDRGSYYGHMMALKDGGLGWPYYERGPDKRLRCGFRIGRWRKDAMGVDWGPGTLIELDPAFGSGGLCEPAVCQFPDGRLFVIMRQNGQRRPAQNQPGFPSVKFIATSEDGGKNWSAPAPLMDDAGSYVYSPASFPDVIRSRKNGRVYVLLNMADHPLDDGCDPRTELYIAELDTARLCLKRSTVTVVEKRHAEHHHLVRFSNWARFEERRTGNLIVYMKMSMAESCPLRLGYDHNQYRYEIELPD